MTGNKFIYFILKNQNVDFCSNTLFYKAAKILQIHLPERGLKY